MEKITKCTYCKCELGDGRAVEVCDVCGVKVWGVKMFKAIMDNMKVEKEKGNMELGRVGETVARDAPQVHNFGNSGVSFK